MKKRLLMLGIAAGVINFTASAQLALENFNSGLPATWTLINDGHTVSSSFTGVTYLHTSLTTRAWDTVSGSHTGFGGASDRQMITTSDFASAAAANRWLITPSFAVTSPNMVIQWDDNDLGSGEYINVKVSPTAGVTAGAFTSTIYSAPASPSGLTTHQAAIGAYNGTSITIAFRDTTNDNWGLLIDNVQTAVLPSYDLGVTSIVLPRYIQTGSSNTLTGVLHNFGYATTTSANINYSINGGSPVTAALTGLSVVLGNNYTYSCATPWVPSTAGTYTVKVWADNINGNVDAVHTNDTFTLTATVIDTVQPKTVMIEEFTQASCDPCANAHTNVDTVYINNAARCEMVRYHVNFPGRDCMDSVTYTPFVSAKLSYYSVSGVPDAQVDGTYVYPGAGGLSSAVVGASAFDNSPFKITITPTVTASTGTFAFSADIHAYGAMAAGLKAYAVLVVDTLTYALNQSTESIPQTVFPQVAEAMFPNASGTTLSAFTAGSTQTITASWVKNHPWASNRSVWSYDSSGTGKIIIWIENDAQKYVYQAAHANISSITTGINAVTGTNGGMDVYPNPATKTATVELSLKSGAEVKMEVYNVLGQLVYSMPAEHRNSGTSHTDIDLSALASGQYFVKVSLNNEVLTKALTVTK